MIWLSRPYLHVFSSQDEREELMVIGLDGVSIETYPEMEELLGVSTTFLFPCQTLTLDALASVPF